MKQKYNSESLPSFHSFLDKFAGKVNTITKRGQISNEKSLKLPSIKSSQIHRSSTVILSREKSYINSLSSQGHRLMPQKSKTINLRAQKYLNDQKTRIFWDIQNNMVNSKLKDWSKKEMKKRTLMQSGLVKIPASHPISQRGQMSDKMRHERERNRQMGVDLEYREFMAQLQRVSRVHRQKALGR